MKGFFLDEFLNFLEERYSWRMAEDVVESAGVESGGLYLWLNDYPSAEFERLLRATAELSGRDAREIARDFGRHLFAYLQRRFPELISGTRDSFSFLTQLPTRLALKFDYWFKQDNQPSVLVMSERGRLHIRLRASPWQVMVAAGLVDGALSCFRDAELDDVRLTTEGEPARIVVRRLRALEEEGDEKVALLNSPVPL